MAYYDERVKQELNRLVELFKTQDLPAVCSSAFITNGNKPAAKWSFRNKIIMLANGTADARGFKQWYEVGRYVKKGTHGFYILAPKMVNRKVIDKETGTESLESFLAGFLAVSVHPYENTDGKPLPEVEPKQLPELFDIAQKIGIKVEYREYNGGNSLGYLSPRTKEIVLYSHEPKVFYHELTHAVQNHIDKTMPTNHESEEYKLNEVVAELTGATIANLYGASSSIDAAAYTYIKYYAGLLEKYGTDNDKVYKSILRVLGKVEKILNFIFTVKDNETGTGTVQVKETLTA